MQCVLACLDELASTAPLPTLRTRMANERALGISFIYAVQTWRQLAALFGDTEARALFGLTNVLIVFGGSKDAAFNQEVADLLGTTRVTRTSWQSPSGWAATGGGGRTWSGEGIPILRPEEIRRLPERQALVLVENGRPILASLHRCIDGKAGARLLAELRAEIWAWLEDVVARLNSQLTWDVAGFIPPCWPRHPHLVHEFAVLADQRRRAGEALTSDALEDWHRYALPAFMERLRGRLQQHCHDGHQPWPARGRHVRATGSEASRERCHQFGADVNADGA